MSALSLLMSRRCAGDRLIRWCGMAVLWLVAQQPALAQLEPEAPTSSSDVAQTLVLVSIDGFRHDYLDLHPAPNLRAIAKQGFRVKQLETIYPPNTFPGHLSLITGLPPEDHGIVDNHFCSTARDECYHMGGGGKDSTWLKGVPLWNLAEAHGLKAATYFWPESDAQWGGTTPSYYFHYSKRAPYEARVSQVIDWLSLPAPARPRLVTLYFSAVDSASHYHGPESEQTAQAVAYVDAQIGELWHRLQTLDIGPINLLVVSDHGMAEIRGSEGILASELPDPEGFERMVSHSRVRYYQRDKQADVAALLESLRAPQDTRFDVLDEAESQAFGGVDVDTAPAAMLITRPPRFFARKPLPADAIEGSHGYPLDVPEMAAFAVGVGPAFVSGIELEQAHQLDVYPLAANILGITPLTEMPSDGGRLRQILNDAFSQ